MKKILPAIVSLSLFCPICDVHAFPPLQGESKIEKPTENYVNPEIVKNIALVIDELSSRIPSYKDAESGRVLYNVSDLKRTLDQVTQHRTKPTVSSNDEQNIICDKPEPDSYIGLPMDTSAPNMTETPTNSEAKLDEPPKTEQQGLDDQTRKKIRKVMDRQIECMGLCAELLTPRNWIPIFPDISSHRRIDEFECMAIQLYQIANLWERYQHLGGRPAERMNRLIELISDKMTLHGSSTIQSQINWQGTLQNSGITLLKFSENDDPALMKCAVRNRLNALIRSVKETAKALKDRYNVAPLIRTLHYVQKIVKESNLHASAYL